MDKKFEDYWLKHKDSLFLVAPQALQDEMCNAGKMNTVGDWVLQAIPILLMVGFINAKVIDSVILSFLVAVVISVVATLLLMPLKRFLTGKRSAMAIEADAKAYFYQIYLKRGLGYLEEIRK